jgi:hypothetical protein
MALYIPEDGTLHNHHGENQKYTKLFKIEGFHNGEDSLVGGYQLLHLKIEAYVPPNCWYSLHSVVTLKTKA